MRHHRDSSPLAVVSLLAISSFFLVGSPAAPARAESSAPATPSSAPSPGTSPVVVELFTSQGCSSCPPADRLLSELVDTSDVLALSFHVDYWNYIGWRDPFSAARWSERQRHYARVFELGRIYTPQLVVDGRFEDVGSNAGRVAEMIERARERSKVGRVGLVVQPGDGALAVTIDAALESTGPDRLDVLLAVVERDLVTPVERGENARRTLRNDNVVRRLVRLGEVTTNAPIEVKHRVEIEPGWRQEKLGIVAFLQDPETLAIHGAAGED